MWRATWCRYCREWSTSTAGVSSTWTWSQTTSWWPVSIPSRSWTLEALRASTRSASSKRTRGQELWSTWVRRGLLSQSPRGSSVDANCVFLPRYRCSAWGDQRWSGRSSCGCLDHRHNYLYHVRESSCLQGHARSTVKATWVLLTLTSGSLHRLSGRLPFEDKDPRQVESKILTAKFDPTKLYPNVSQSASAFLKKMLSSYPWWGIASMRGHQILNQFVQCPYSRCCFQGPRGDQGLLRPSLASRLLPDEAQASDSHLHLQPAQGVPGGATIPPLGGRHQAQGAAAHLPELPTVPGGWLCSSSSQPQVTRRRNAIKSWYETQPSWASLYFPPTLHKSILVSLNSARTQRMINLVENVKVPRSKLLMYNCLHLLKKCKGQNQFVFFLKLFTFSMLIYLHACALRMNIAKSNRWR